jgi:alkylation response protein AidB-like acyl-CoA dehydrogenase
VDFEVRYTQEQESFRKEVSGWLDENCPAEVIGSEWIHTPPDVYAKQRELGRKLGAKGWLYPTAPTEYGGGGLGTDAARVIMEEMNARGLNLPPYYDSGGVLGSMAILVWGTEEQKRKLLPPIYKGEVRTWQLLTEPSAGSDLAGVSTSAMRDGDHYVITGQKLYIGSDNGAEGFWTIARTGDPNDRHRNLSWFWIDGGTPGLSWQPMRLLGNMDKNTVFLDEVRVHADALVGGENNGWKVASTHLELEHGFRTDITSTQNEHKTLDRLIAHCQQTVIDGQRLIDRPGVRDQLVRLHTHAEIARVWGIRNFWMARQGKQTYEGSQSSYFSKIHRMNMTRLIAELAGPAGMMRGGPAPAAAGELASVAESAIGASHGGGTVDVQRVVMSRRLGIGRAEGQSGAKLA